MIDIFNHRQAPSSVLTRRRVLATAGRLLRAGREPRREVLAQLLDLSRDDARHRHLNRRPVLVPEPHGHPDRSEEELTWVS